MSRRGSYIEIKDDDREGIPLEDGNVFYVQGKTVRGDHWVKSMTTGRSWNWTGGGRELRGDELESALQELEDWNLQ